MGRRGGDVVPRSTPRSCSLLSMLSPPLLFVTFLSPAESSVIMAKGKRGAKFTTAELEHLLSIVEEILPIGAPEWERVWDRHDSAFRAKERTPESLKRKFQELARKKIPTGDPECPPYVRKAKHIYHKIVLATDGSTGNSDDLGFENEDDGEDG